MRPNHAAAPLGLSVNSRTLSPSSKESHKIIHPQQISFTFVSLCKIWLKPREAPMISLPSGSFPNGVELKAERRKPSGEKHCDIKDIPLLTGVLAHFRLH
jgi:hypothetical protein